MIEIKPLRFNYNGRGLKFVFRNGFNVKYLCSHWLKSNGTREVSDRSNELDNVITYMESSRSSEDKLSEPLFPLINATWNLISWMPRLLWSEISIQGCIWTKGVLSLSYYSVLLMKDCGTHTIKVSFNEASFDCRVCGLVRLFERLIFTYFVERILLHSQETSESTIV